MPTPNGVGIRLGFFGGFPGFGFVFIFVLFAVVSVAGTRLVFRFAAVQGGGYGSAVGDNEVPVSRVRYRAFFHRGGYYAQAPTVQGGDFEIRAGDAWVRGDGAL